MGRGIFRVTITRFQGCLQVFGLIGQSSRVPDYQGKKHANIIAISSFQNGIKYHCSTGLYFKSKTVEGIHDMQKKTFGLFFQNVPC